MKITNVEIIPIFPKLAERYETQKVRLRGFDHRIVYKLETDKGITGFGDQRIRPGKAPDPSSVEHLIGQNPFHYLNNTYNGGLGAALYDVMGKYAGVPAYRLMGPKVRDVASVAAWTRPASPEEFSKEIIRASNDGYRIFKMHSCTHHDVIAQTKAAEEVAPEGFKIHWDFNSNRSVASMLPLVAELEKNHPIVGFVEDPIVRSDIEGWRTIRDQSRIPIVMHVPQLGGLQEMILGLADIFMIGSNIGDALMRGFAYSKANFQTIMQHGAGVLGKAMALHMSAVLPSASGHMITLDDQYGEDYVKGSIPVDEGFSPVPEGPGLGFEVDEDALARLAANDPNVVPRHVGRLYLPGGRMYYTPGFPNVPAITGREEGTIRGLRSDLWEEDGSADFEEAYEKVQKLGAYSPQGGA